MFTKRRAWKMFARKVGGQFISGGIFFSFDQVLVPYKDWSVRVFTADGPALGYKETRASAIYSEKHPFYFCFYRPYWPSHFVFRGAPFMTKMSTGYAELDDFCDVYTSDETTMSRVLMDQRLRSLIRAALPGCFRTLDSENLEDPSVVPMNCGMLGFETAGVIRDVKELKVLYELLTCMLDRLSEVGVAAPIGGDVATTPHSA